MLYACWLFLVFGLLVLLEYGNDDDVQMMQGYIDLPAYCQYCAIGCTAVVAYLQYLATMVVSHPGAAREHKIRRVPKWEEKCTELDIIQQKQWRCVVAEESHAITVLQHCQGVVKQEEEEDVSINHLISGEPAGRQIWTYTGAKQGEKGSNVNSNATPKKKPKHSNTSTPKESPAKIWIEGILNFGSNKRGEEGIVTVDEDYVQLLASGGREYTGFDPSKNPNSCDRIFRAQQIRHALQVGELEPPSLSFVPNTAKEAAKKGFRFYSMLQTDDGHWAGDYGGPHFLMPGIIIAWYVLEKPDALLNHSQREMMMHYLSVHQQADGGWGTHVESPSTMFGTVSCYVSMRLLGADANSYACQKARAFIQNEGGALYTSSWSKFWLCLLGCMEWEGHNR